MALAKKSILFLAKANIHSFLSIQLQLEAIHYFLMGE